jgi:hypothetical protein
MKEASEYQDENAWSFLLTVFVLSRLFFFGVGAVATALLPHIPATAESGDHQNPEGFFEMWARWDGGWFSRITAEWT